MNDADRKLLTEYIGECWHTLTAFLDNGIIECSCGARMSRGPDEATFHVEQENNRTFSTWADLGAVMEAIVKKGEWGDFMCFAARKWCEINKGKTLYLSGDSNVIDFTAWLMDPSRFCALVAEWAKERGWEG